MNIKGKALSCILCMTLVLVILGSLTSMASAELKVITVPWYPDDVKIPHDAYNGHPTTFKAIARGGTETTYIYEWDFNGDGTYDYTNITTNPYDLSARYTYPDQAGDVEFIATIEVTNGGETAIGQYPVSIHVDDLTQEVKINVAIDDALWWMHNRMYRYPSGGVPCGYINGGNYYVGYTAGALWAFEVQGHLLTKDYDTDPYVEDVQRGLNYLFTRTTRRGISTQNYGDPEEGVPAENNNDYGLHCYYRLSNGNYEQGLVMGAISGSGDPDRIAEIGTYTSGRTYKWIVQEMADYYAWAQLDYRTSNGNTGWEYYANRHYRDAGDGSLSQWAYIGLEAGETNFGIIVPQWVKDNVANYLYYDQIHHPDPDYWTHGSFKYRSSYGVGSPDLQLTGGGIIGMAWLGLDDPASPYYDSSSPRYNGLNKYQHYLDAIDFIGTQWSNNNADPYRMKNVGSMYAMYSVMKGARTVWGDRSQPEPQQIESFGTHDWYDEYATWLINNQYADGHWRGVDGWIDNYLREYLGTAFGVLILTPSVFEPPPTAEAKAEPPEVPCGGGESGTVTLDHSESKHTLEPDVQIINYKWDFDASDGIDFDNPDYQTPDGMPPEEAKLDSATHIYAEYGTYTATLRVIDSNGKWSEDTVTITVNITNHSPVADPDPDDPDDGYSVLQNEGVIFDGSASYDPDEDCGDSITSYAWDLDDDGSFDDGSTAQVSLDWAQLVALDLGNPGTYTIRLQVQDELGGVSVATTTIDIIPNILEAVAEADITDTRPGITITFDGSGSNHSNPARTIVSYEWDFGDSNSATGPIVTHAYESSGDYTVTLTVTDDNIPPLTDDDTILISISSANHAPVADPDGPYKINVGEGVTLNAGASYDPDQDFGDSIVSYEWDFDGDGAFDDATGVTVSLTWTQVSDLFEYPAIDNPIALRVTDEPGATHEATTTLTIYENLPIAIATATPEEADINDSITFDASGSYHTHPDHAIVRHEWDWDSDGTYDEEGVTVTHSWEAYGTMPVTLRITDDNDPANTATTTITVIIRPPNHPPTAVPGGPYVIAIGEGVTLDGSGSFDINEDDPEPWTDSIVSYEWDLDNDGQFDDADGAIVALTWAELEALGLAYPADPETGKPENTIRLRVTDSHAATNIAATVLRIYMDEPVAVATATPADTRPGTDITFDGSGSYHRYPARNLVQYLWDFGDGDSATGALVTHQYSLDGVPARTFTATLTVVDDNPEPKEAIDTVEVLISIDNHQPMSDPDGPYIVTQGESVTLDGSDSSDQDEPFGDTITFAWDIDSDGLFDDAFTETVNLTSDQLISDYGYALGTAKDIGLKVTDTFGLSHEALTSLGVYENDPVAIAKAVPVEVGCKQEVSFNGSDSYHKHPLRSIVKYEWDFESDGTYDSEEMMPKHSYPEFGTYQATLRVTDNNVPPKTATDQVEISVTIGNSKPVADANPDPEDNDYTTSVGGCIKLDGSQSYDPDEDCGDSIVIYEWDTDNDGLFGEEDDPDDLVGMIILCYNNPAWQVDLRYTVHLRVTDEFGARDLDTAYIAILPNMPPVANCTDVTVDADENCQASASIDSYSWDPDPDDTITLSQDPPGPYGLGDTLVTLTVTDSYGATDTCDATVSVVDTAPPVLENCPGNIITDNDSGQCGAVVTWTPPTASDNCQDVSLSSTHTPGVFFPVGTTTVTYTATDGSENSDSCSFTVTVEDNELPVVSDCPGSITVPNDSGQCGAVVTWTPPTFTDNCMIASIDKTHTPGDFFTSECAATASGTQVTYTATDSSGNITSCSFNVTVVDKDPPVVGEIVTTLDPVQINSPVYTSADFTDSCTFNTHTALWDWGDGDTSSGDVTESEGSGSVAGDHTYTSPGVYTVTVTVTDDCGNSSDISKFQYIVVYDPDGGFVTGGGWIDSPEGAYNLNPTLTGKANFGFVSKYKRGTTTPTGQTEFQFKVADLNFHSASYEWLVVGGPRAQFKGTGTINGEGNYGFILTAIDGQIPGGGGTDKFRIMIWNIGSGGGIVYDNQPGAPVDGDSATVIGGGSIVIHTKK